MKKSDQNKTIAISIYLEKLFREPFLASKGCCRSEKGLVLEVLPEPETPTLGRGKELGHGEGERTSATSLSRAVTEERTEILVANQRDSTSERSAAVRLTVRLFSRLIAKGVMEQDLAADCGMLAVCIEALRDDEKSVRAAACQQLGQLGLLDAEAALRQVAESDSETYIRRMAEQAINDLHAPRITDGALTNLPIRLEAEDESFNAIATVTDQRGRVVFRQVPAEVVCRLVSREESPLEELRRHLRELGGNLPTASAWEASGRHWHVKANADATRDLFIEIHALSDEAENLFFELVLPATIIQPDKPRGAIRRFESRFPSLGISAEKLAKGRCDLRTRESIKEEDSFSGEGLSTYGRSTGGTASLAAEEVSLNAAGSGDASEESQSGSLWIQPPDRRLLVQVAPRSSGRTTAVYVFSDDPKLEGATVSIRVGAMTGSAKLDENTQGPGDRNGWLGQTELEVSFQHVPNLPLEFKVEVVDPELLAHMSQRMRDPDSAVRRRAVEALAQMGEAVTREPGMVAQLTQCLGDPDSGVRAEAAVALARLGRSAAESGQP